MKKLKDPGSSTRVMESLEGEIRTVSNDGGASRLFVIRGSAGAGKSYLADSFARRLAGLPTGIEGRWQEEREPNVRWQTNVRSLHLRWSDFLRLPLDVEDRERAVATFLPYADDDCKRENVAAKLDEFKTESRRKGSVRIYLVVVHDIEQALALDETKERLQATLRLLLKQGKNDPCRFLIVLTSRVEVLSAYPEEFWKGRVEGVDGKSQSIDKEVQLDGLGLDEARSLLFALDKKGFRGMLARRLGVGWRNSGKIEGILSAAKDEASSCYSPLRLSMELARAVMLDPNESAPAPANILTAERADDDPIDARLMDVYSEAVGRFAACRDTDSRMRTLVAASAFLACRPRSSFVYTETMSAMFDEDFAGPLPWLDVVTAARDRINPEIASPGGSDAQQAALLSFLFLTSDERMYQPQHSFFQRDLDDGFAKERSWEPRHPTAIDFSRRLLLANLALSRGIVGEADLPVQAPFGAKYRREAQDLAERLRANPDLGRKAATPSPLPIPSQPEAYEPKPDVANALERIGVRAFLGVSSAAREVIDAIDERASPYASRILTDALAAMTGRIDWFYKLSGLPSPWKDLNETWITEPNADSLDPERTFATALLAERAYQDHDRWTEARNYGESLCRHERLLASEGPRFVRHRGFATAMVAIQIADKDGDAVGSLIELESIDAVEDPAVVTVREAVRAINQLLLGCGKAEDSWNECKRAIRGTTHSGYVDPDLDRKLDENLEWIAYARRSAGVQRTITRVLANACPPEGPPSTSGAPDWRAAAADSFEKAARKWGARRIDEGKREPVYAIAECAYRATQAIAPKTLQDWLRIEGGAKPPPREDEAPADSIERLLHFAKRYGGSFEGDSWMDTFVSITEATCLFWRHRHGDDERSFEQARASMLESIAWFRENMPQESEFGEPAPHYSQTLSELLLIQMERLHRAAQTGDSKEGPGALTARHLSDVYLKLTDENVYGDSHWFRGLLAYLVQLCVQTGTGWALPEPIEPFSVARPTVPTILGELNRLRLRYEQLAANEPARRIDAHEIATELRRSWIRVLVAQQLSLVFSEKTELVVRWSQLDEVLDVLCAYASASRSEPDSRVFVESHKCLGYLGIRAGDGVLNDLLKRLDVIRKNQPGPEYLAGSYAASFYGQKIEPMPPLLLPDFNMYRSMPAYLSRI